MDFQKFITVLPEIEKLIEKLENKPIQLSTPLVTGGFLLVNLKFMGYAPSTNDRNTLYYFCQSLGLRWIENSNTHTYLITIINPD